MTMAQIDGGGIFAVVVDRSQGAPGDTTALAKAAAAVLGVTAYDVRASLNASSSGPSVIAAFADSDHAAATREGLVAAGLHARVVRVDAKPPRMSVRGFELGPNALVVTDRQGQSREVDYADVELLVRATALTSTETTTTKRERKLDVGRALLTGGLMNTRVQKTQTTSRATATTDVLVVFARSGEPLRMADDELVFQGLGAAIQPSRTANFQYTVGQLQQRCPAAKFDERLRHRVAQTQLLGHTLSPDTYLPFAITLLADSLRALS